MFSVGPENRSIFQDVLGAIGRKLPFPSRLARCGSNSARGSLRQLGTTKHYAECLQLLLDCLPAADCDAPGGSGRAPMSPVPLHVNFEAPSSSLSAVKHLQTRLGQVNSALDIIRDRATGRAGNVENDQWTAPYSEFLANYTAQKTLAQRVCTELNSKYIQTNLR